MTPTELCEILTYARDKSLGLGTLHCLSYVHLKERATMTDIARHIGTTTTSVTQMADKLVSLGYVTRRREPGDRRAVYLEITGMGTRVIETALMGPNPSLV